MVAVGRHVRGRSGGELGRALDGDLPGLVFRPDRLSVDEAEHLAPVGLTASTTFLGFTVVRARGLKVEGEAAASPFSARWPVPMTA